MEVSDSTGRILSGLLEARTGQQLGLGRRWRIEATLQPLVRERGFASLDSLVAALVSRSDESLAAATVEALLNNETFFYRDRASFELLLGPGLARLEEARRSQRRLSIWCAGCSTGQEVWSLAMHFAEQKARWAGWRIDLVGTDVSSAAIRQAESGTYSQFEVQRGLAILQMMRWFEERPAARWQLSAEIRRTARFEVRSLLADPPPPGRFDLILCRNVLLYFSPENRRIVLDRLAGAAADDAALMLGAGETVIGQTGAFVPDPDCRGLYRREPAQAEGRRAAS
jgi:chemotaxis protein methyltransferase CheR